MSKDFILQLEVLFSQLNYLLCESNKIYLAGLSVSDWESIFLNPLQDSFQKTVLSL